MISPPGQPSQDPVKQFLRRPEEGAAPANFGSMSPGYKAPAAAPAASNPYQAAGSGAADPWTLQNGKPAAARPDPWAYLGDAMKGYQNNVNTLQGLNNPWESTMTLGALDKSRAGIAAQGARAGVHNQNDAIKRMMAGGGLIAQGDLNAMNDNMRAGVLNQQNALYADYNKNRIGWEDQKQQHLANQYDRMTELSMMPGRLEGQGLTNTGLGLNNERARLGNLIANQDAYEYTTQEAANQRAALRDFQLKDASLDWQKKNQDVYEYTKPEAANWRGLMLENTARAQNANVYENEISRNDRMATIGVDRARSQAQLDQIYQQMETARRNGDMQTAQQLGTLGARIAKQGGFKWLGAGIGALAGTLGPQALLGGTGWGAAGGAALGEGLDWLLGGDAPAPEPDRTRTTKQKEGR